MVNKYWSHFYLLLRRDMHILIPARSLPSRYLQILSRSVYKQNLHIMILIFLFRAGTFRSLSQSISSEQGTSDHVSSLFPPSRDLPIMIPVCFLRAGTFWSWSQSVSSEQGTSDYDPSLSPPSRDLPIMIPVCLLRAGTFRIWSQSISSEQGTFMDPPQALSSPSRNLRILISRSLSIFL